MTASFSSLARALHELVTQLGGSANASLADADFHGLALQLFAHQRELNPDYRRWCESRGFSRRPPGRWSEVPSVPTSAFKLAPFSCLPPGQRTHVFESSGTTASARSRHYHSAESLALYAAALRPWFRHHLLPRPDPAGQDTPPLRFLSLTPSPALAPRSSLVHMLGCVADHCRFAGTCFAGRLDEAGQWVVDTEAAGTFAAASGSTPLLVAGAAFNFVHWLDAMEKPGACLPLPAGSRVMETGGYKGRTRTLSKARLHQWIAETLSVPLPFIVTEYGMTELSSQAYDRIAGMAGDTERLRFPPWVRATVISPETGEDAAPGEPGLLRVFDLANAWSVMAVETEDLAVRDQDGLRLLGRQPESEPRGCSLMAGAVS